MRIIILSLIVILTTGCHGAYKWCGGPVCVVKPTEGVPKLKKNWDMGCFDIDVEANIGKGIEEVYLICEVKVDI